MPRLVSHRPRLVEPNVLNRRADGADAWVHRRTPGEPPHPRRDGRPAPGGMAGPPHPRRDGRLAPGGMAGQRRDGTTAGSAPGQWTRSTRLAEACFRIRVQCLCTAPA